jgi:transposase
MKHGSMPVRVGIDLAKEVFQVHAVDNLGTVVEARQVSRERLLPWCASLPPQCTVAMESCATSHFWARQVEKLGVEVRLIAPSFVGPYRLSGRGGKNDAADAAAICEAASRPHMRFVPVKTVERQGWSTVHRLRQGYMKDRTGAINRARGLLAEYGLVFPLSPEKFLSMAPEAVRDRTNELTPLARTGLRRALAHIASIDSQIAWCDARIAEHVRKDRNVKLAMSICGVGAFTASALAADVGDLTQFKNGRQFGAWLGLVPRQHSSGGKQRLGRITKRGDAYLRYLMVMGAKAAMRVAKTKDDEVSRWVCQLKERVGWQKACVALANKNARHLWVLLTGRAPQAASTAQPRLKARGGGTALPCGAGHGLSVPLAPARPRPEEFSAERD